MAAIISSVSARIGRARSSAADDLVVDVGDVAHVGHAVAAGAQPAVDDVEGQHHARMAQVAQVVHGDAADVHAHVPGLDGDEGFEAAGQRVVDDARPCGRADSR
jgi:hypothetical protein